MNVFEKKISIIMVMMSQHELSYALIEFRFGYKSAECGNLYIFLLGGLCSQMTFNLN
jgi:hypothetical protein